MPLQVFTKGTTGKNMQVKVEMSQDALLAEIFTGDSTNKIFTTSNASIFSLFTDAADTIDRTPVMKCDGVVSGGVVTPGTAVDDVDISAVVCWIDGVSVSVAAASAEDVPKGATDAYYIIHAVTVTAAGAIAIVNGTEGASLSGNYGDAGGKPYTPATSILLGYVTRYDDESAVVTLAEISQVPNQSREVSVIPYPVYDVQAGTITFEEALMANHTGDITKSVVADVYSPTSFTTLTGIASISLPGETPASNTVQTPDGTSVAQDPNTLENGALVVLTDGSHNDLPALIDNTTAVVRFWPNSNKTDYYEFFAGISGRLETPVSGGQMQYNFVLIPRTGSSRKNS